MAERGSTSEDVEGLLLGRSEALHYELIRITDQNYISQRPDMAIYFLMNLRRVGFFFQMPSLFSWARYWQALNNRVYLMSPPGE